MLLSSPMRGGPHLFLSVFVTLWSQPTNSVFASSPPPSPPPPSRSLGIIVGCTLGGIALAVITAMLFLIRRALQSQNTSSLPGRVPLLDLDAPRVEDNRHDTTISRVPGQKIAHSTPSEQLGPATPTKSTVSHPPPSPLATVTSGPMTGDFQATLSHRARSQDRRRSARQTEINERLRSAQQEMNNLTTAESVRTTSSSRPSTEAEQEVASLRTQIHNLRNQIDHLQREQQSEWALGLSDDEPPAYS